MTLHGAGTWRIRTGGGERPSLRDVLAGDPLDVALPARLGPGERHAIPAPLGAGGRTAVVAQLDADVPYEGRALRLACVLFAGHDA